jgi:hypothetical protein
VNPPRGLPRRLQLLSRSILARLAIAPPLLAESLAESPRALVVLPSVVEQAVGLPSAVGWEAAKTPGRARAVIAARLPLALLEALLFLFLC